MARLLGHESRASKSAMTSSRPAGAENRSHSGGVDAVDTADATDVAPFYVRYRNAQYDLRHFVHKHPGGRSTLHGLDGRDMEQRLRNAPPHSAAAMYLLREYRVDATTDVDENNNEQRKADGRLPDEWDAQTDDSMEHLVDWSAAMIPQIGRLGANYTDWVNKPVDRPLRLFHADWLEMLTRTPWWLVPAFWVPAIASILFGGVQRAAAELNWSATAIVLTVTAGLLLWTVLEYTLHRFVFHVDTTGAGRLLCTLHFVLHGLHHKVPFDPYRLVFPPVPAIVLASVLYVPLPWLSRCPELLLAGGLMGYLCYDMTHYYIHYGSPAPGYMYNLKRYHYQHHFVHHDRGFGISSPVWDDVFGTRILLQKLQYVLRW